MTEGQKPTATMDGKPLILGETPIQWTLKPGIHPSVGSFDMAPDDAKSFLGRTTPVTLEIHPLDGAPVIVNHLWVLNVEPGENPFISRVKVADRRWFWHYAHVTRRYNMRRNVGVKRLLANDAALEVNFDRAADIAYWRWSLNNSAKWESFTMLSDVMSAIAQIEKDYWGQTFKVIVDDRIGQKISTLPIEELTFEDSGDEAVGRAVAYLPEAEVTVDYDGTVIIFSRAAGDEIKIVSALMPEMFGMGHADLVLNDVIRPKEVHILFTRECEVRFDFLETALAVGATTTDDPLGDRREMQNVLPIPDYQLTVNGRTLPQGTYADFDDVFRSWPDLPIAGTARKLDHDLCQRAFIPQMDLWATLGVTGELPDSQGDLSNWVGRIAACQEHYRQTFQLNSKWMDRALSIRAYRLATINPQTGQRGPSIAYGDYCILPSQRARYRSIAQGHPMYYAINKSAYAATLDSTALPSPGIVSVLDNDQGVIRVDYVMDQVRSYEMVLPSQMELDSMPAADFTQRERPIAFNAVLEGQSPPRLAASFKLAVILTLVPASPNNNQQLHRIVVKPQDISDLLPEAARAGLGNAKGPILEYRIGAGTEVARTRWDDAKATVTEQIFGITSIGNDPKSQAAFSRQVSELTLNEGSTGGKAGASLNEIARAQAAAIYASFVDRYEGTMTAHMNGNVHLSGWIDEINHVYGSKGETLTQVVFPTAIPQMTLLSFLSRSERAVMLKLVQP